MDWRALYGDAYRGRNVLVTGGAGFIGSHLAGALVGLGANVTVIDDLAPGGGGAAANVPAGARFVLGSILDASALKDAMTGLADGVVFHEAALGSVPRSMEEPELYMTVNVMGTLRVLEGARRVGVARVVFAASSSAYGDTEELPKHEGMVARPLSPYAASKVAGEALMHAWANGYGLDTVSLRYFNIFGPRQSATSAYAAVIAAFATALLSGRRPKIFGDGSQSRDFTHVNNAVHANLLGGRHAKPLRGGVLNVATGTRVTVMQLAESMAKLLGVAQLTPEYHPPRAGDVLHSQASLEQTRRVLGYEVITGLEEGLAETLRWYREQTAPGK